MPYKPATPCKKQGCPNLTNHPRGYCPEHLSLKHREEDKNRLPSHKRGYDRRWRKERRDYLKANSLCVECLKEERVTAATVVDHIIPAKGNPELFWDRDNWQSLCKPHHDRKTATEDGAFKSGDER